MILKKPQNTEIKNKMRYQTNLDWKNLPAMLWERFCTVRKSLSKSWQLSVGNDEPQPLVFV